MNRFKVALLVGAVYCIVRGIAYLPITEGPEKLPRGLELISEVFPIYFWALIWIIVGVFSIVKINCSHYLAWAFISSMMIAWGTAYFIGFAETLIQQDFSRDWLPGSTYLLPGIMIAILSNPSRQTKEDLKNA